MGDQDSNAGKQSKMILDATYTWTEQFYDMPIAKVLDIIDKNSKNGIVYIEYSYKQLGKDDNWFRRVCKTVDNRPEKIKREILLYRMRGNSNSPYDPEDLLALQELKPEPIEEIMINEFYKLDIYKTLDKSLPYLVGIDVAAGTNGDNSAFTVVHPYTLEVVAEFASPLISPNNLKKFIYTVTRRHIPKAILCIERNNSGDAIISDLLETMLAPNLYFDNSKDFISDGIDERLDAKGFLIKEANRRKMYGVWTGPKSRKAMFDILYLIVKERKDQLTSRNVVNDILGLVEKNSKVQAGEGAHDDSIMSYNIALYVYYHGRNLHRYGLVKGAQYKNEENLNKGLYETHEQIVGMLSEEDAKTFDGVATFDSSDYMMKTIKEQQMYRREVEHFEQSMNAKTQVECFNSSMDEYDEFGMFDSGGGSGFLDMFDDLNDF